ncbi:MAG: cytochrome c biogenesis protein CcsA [Bacteroidales bacterium]
MDLHYIGEHLLSGQAGRFALFVAFFAALFSTLSFYLGSRDKEADALKWRHWGRRTFQVHGLMVGVASLFLFYILLNRFYEYRYVWVHVENDLGLGYVMAAFWAGQEGSFLFWILCQALFGLVLLRHAGKWEAPVMAIVALSQTFMLTMVLGVQIGGFSVGMSPFLLLRESAENLDNLFFQNPQYLSLITDGNGLNPLLRNFWMLSHPPFTFIGYASVLIPFSFALAGLWKRRFHDWIRPALPWTILGVFFLGIGILLGGVWAYESLTFGGFWAWDPIENASLVPWLVLVASLHLMLVAKKKRSMYFPAFLFSILSFILVVYATYLTRSGVLSDTSVHSFGNDGMGRQILVYIMGLSLLGLFLLVKNYRRLPGKDSEEPFSREFWLFVGALVLVLSAFQIFFTTSIPVVNRLLGTSLTPPMDPVSHYNTWQLPFAVVIALLIGTTHFIGWGKNQGKRFLARTGLSVVLALVFSVVVARTAGIEVGEQVLMLFASLFALFSSLDLLLRVRPALAGYGAVVSHLGMALFLLAVLLTFSQKTTISQNTSGYFLGQTFSEDENLLLIQGEVLPMGEYHVTYVGNTREGNRIEYQVDFLKKNRHGAFYRAFSSFPSILLNERMGNVYEPHARVFPLRDVFTYITFADTDQSVTPTEPPLVGQFTLAVNDTIGLGNNSLVLGGLQSDTPPDQAVDPRDIRVTASLEVLTHFGESFIAQPAFLVRDGLILHEDDVVADLDLRFRFRNVTETPFTIVVDVYEDRPEFIVIKTVIFPFINLLWFSILVLLAGLLLAFRSRWKKQPGV